MLSPRVLTANQCFLHVIRNSGPLGNSVNLDDLLSGVDCILNQAGLALSIAKAWHAGDYG